MLGSTLITYYLINGMHGASSKNRRKMLLVIALLVNIGILVYFKYANFFLENVSELMLRFGFKELGWMRIALPIGISFYTFQSLSYCLDVYRGVREPLDRAADFTLYIIMFPQLIAGPIVRFNTIASQIRSRQENDADRLTGFIRFSIGLAKKVLIANVMGRQADLIMGGDIQALGSGAAWLGLMAYSFQIYFDFAGYSDMAIGIGRMIGFRFPENFNNPYVSGSITEFWRRWHMTLSAWMRDYLYIPLGGNRVKTRGRLFFNLWVVFLISGLWHGAAWNFIIWGGYHGLFLVLDRLFLKKVLDGIGRVPAMLFTFFVATLGWVVFRIESLPDAMNFYGKLFAFDFGRLDILSNLEFSITLVPAIFFSFITMFRIGRRWEQMVYFEPHSPVRMAWLGSISILLFVLSVGSITASGFNPFIYFRF
jgi:alginate O-acetyltransferase complex protein AlgI